MSEPEAPLASAVEQLHAWLQQGRADEAVARARALLAGLQAAGPADAEAANRLGMLFFELDFGTEALQAYRRALALLDAAAAPDDTLRASLHNNLGQALMALGQLPEAQQQLERSLALRRQASHPMSLAMTADNLGAVLAARGRLDRARALHDEALAVFDAAGPAAHGHLATALGNLGNVHRRSGHVALARACLLRAIDLHLSRGGLDNPQVRIPLVNLIDLAIEQGDAALAGEMLDVLLQMAGRRGGAAAHPVALALLTLGSAALRQFQLGPAERAAAAAVGLLGAQATTPDAVRAQRLLANVQAAKGNFLAAEAGLMPLLDAPGLPPAQAAELLIDLGKAVRARGRGSEAAAIGLFEHAARRLRGLPGGEPRLLASALGNLGLAHLDADELGRAEACTREALSLAVPGRAGVDRAWLQHNLALMHYHAGRYAEARAGLASARRRWRRRLGPHHPFVATADANLALVHWSSGQAAAAQRAFARAAALRAGPLQRMLLVGTEAERLAAAAEHLDDLFKQVTFCLRGAGGPAMARQAAGLLLQRKAIVLDALAWSQQRLRERLGAHARPLLDRLLELRRQIASRLLAAPLAGDAAGDAHALADLQGEEERLQTALGHAGAFGAAGLAPVALADVRAALPASAQLLELLRWTAFDPLRSGRGSAWRGDSYAALLLGRRGAPAWFDLGDAGPIDAAAEHWRALLRDPDSAEAALDAAAAALRERLLAPLQGRLARARTLFVAPDGPLNLLPWGLLAEPLLATQCSVSQLTSGRELLRPAHAAAPGAAVVAFVDPDYGEPDAHSRLRLQPLPGTRAEGRALQAVFPQAQILAGAGASAGALRRVAAPALLHVATHGLFLPAERPAPLWRSRTLSDDEGLLVLQGAGPSVAANPMWQAGLLLAGANRSTPQQLAGFVSAAELAMLDLRGTELVVLSACDTGLGRATPGAEFAGLRRALAIAGAAGQVISLWEVDDEAAADLMAAFYRALHAGAAPAAALQQAQRALRRRPRWAHPSAWAAFVAWGAGAPLSAALRSEGGAA